MNVLFSGVGAQERGFENSGLFDVKVLTTSDINKEAVLSYAAIHCGLAHEMVDNYEDYPSREEMAQYLTEINLGYEPEKNKRYDWFKFARRKKNDIEKYWLACRLTNNLGDISKIEELPYADLWTCSFPCTDVSVSGKMKGLNPDSGTRSSLLWENIRLLKKAVEDGKSPKYLMFENVKNLVSKKFISDFNNLIEVLEELGFNTYWKVINGKDCGIPQNRERVFAFAIRKDIDTGKMDFPKPFDNGVKLKDVLEDSVDEKYYLNDEVVKRFITNLNTSDALLYDPCQAKRDRMPKILQRPRGLNNGGEFEDCPSITSHSWETNNVLADGVRIRKLTPTETFVLMGFENVDCNKAKEVGVSDSQLYRQAGNSIITNCVELLAEHLYKAQYDNDFVCFDENFTQP